MFSIETFIRDAHQGEPVADLQGFCDYMNGFRSVVLWGAGNLGAVIGKKFADLGISISAYWDAKYKEKESLNGIRVIEPFTGDFGKEDTVVVFCIANVPMAPPLFARLQQGGWIHRISGLAILEGLICPFAKGKRVDPEICARNTACALCSCERLSNIMKAQPSEYGIPEEEKLSFDRVHFIVNNFCNLKCTHCFMYMNTYPPEKKKNTPLDVLTRDIRLVMEAVHSFGVVNVFGGEPFLHPNLSDIVEKILEYDNFAAVIVNTNGAARMRAEQMESLKSSRVRLAFSNYKGALTDKQESMVHDNLEYARSLGINAQMMNELAGWNISSTLGNNHCTPAQRKERSDKCAVKFLYVFDHKVYPCAFALSIKDLNIADYKDSYIDLDEANTPEKLRAAIKALVARDSYNCCGHCDDLGIGDDGFAALAGEQGFDKRYEILAK